MRGSTITSETREAGFQAILPFIDAIKERVLSALRANPRGLMAEEVAKITGDSLNSCRSRLTETTREGKAFVVGKRISSRTGILVSAWATK